MKSKALALATVISVSVPIWGLFFYGETTSDAYGVRQQSTVSVSSEDYFSNLFPNEFDLVSAVLVESPPPVGVIFFYQMIKGTMKIFYSNRGIRPIGELFFNPAYKKNSMKYSTKSSSVPQGINFFNKDSRFFRL